VEGHAVQSVSKFNVISMFYYGLLNIKYRQSSSR